MMSLKICILYRLVFYSTKVSMKSHWMKPYQTVKKNNDNFYVKMWKCEKNWRRIYALLLLFLKVSESWPFWPCPKANRRQPCIKNRITVVYLHAFTFFFGQSGNADCFFSKTASTTTLLFLTSAFFQRYQTRLSQKLTKYFL